MSGYLKLTFQPDAKFGAKPLCMTLSLDEHTCRELMHTKPPFDALGLAFDDVVETMKRREFRKDLFVRECRRIGALLAERMEDAEGWHDSSRIEPAKRELGLSR